MLALETNAIADGPPTAADRNAALHMHGGNLSAARTRFPDAPLPWVDLSTGVSPHAYPVGALQAETWTRLPDPAALAELHRAAALRYGVTPAAGIVAAPGTQALIQFLPRFLPARHVAVLRFGYQEHPASWRAAGVTVTTASSFNELSGADVAVVINPNNPDGRLIAPALLIDLARHLASRGGALVVDEAFMDVVDPAMSLVPHLPQHGAIVLRSFGKFFGLAGLRLGFAVTEPDRAARLAAGLGAWAVSGPAIAIGTRALADGAWQRETRRSLERDSARLDSLLDGAGFVIRGGTSLFRLVERPDAADWFEQFGAAGILVRPFATHPTWLRLGLPADPEGWDRLTAALRR